MADRRPLAPLTDSEVAGAYPAIRFAPPSSSTASASQTHDGGPQQQRQPQQPAAAAALPASFSLSGGGGGGGAAAAGAPQLYENSPRAGSNPFHRILVGSGSFGGGAARASANGSAAAAAAGGGLAPPAPPAHQHQHQQQHHNHHHYPQPSPNNGTNGGGAAALPGRPSQQQQQQQQHEVDYGARAPIRRDVSWLAVAILVAYAGSLAFYCYVRVMMLLPSAGLPNRWYSALIFAIELLGATAVLPYALLNTSHLHATGSPGLPEADGARVCSACPFHVRVLVPCYNEPLDVVTATVAAALDAPLPPSTRRSVYLCDDGKRPALRAWLEATYGTCSGSIHPPAPADHPRAVPRVLGVGTPASLAAAARFPGRDAIFYVGDRVRAPGGEVNGKSANLNHCLREWIYKGIEPAAIPQSEVVVVFDADMCASRDFFLKILEPMTDRGTALCLTPQAYTNVFQPEDIFNNINVQWWQYSLPGLTALGYVACTGTNFCIRAAALAACGWFPQYTITEDFALGLELKVRGYRGTYLNSYLAKGEAPTELRNIFRQRSRWCKGHMQIALSRRNPLIRPRLPLLQRLLYNNGTWAYVVTVVTTPAFVLVPFLSVFANLDPVRFGGLTPLALTLYLTSGFLVQSYVHTPLDSQALWMATLSNQLLAFTYFKAMANVFLSKIGLKKKVAFKVTTKGGGTGGGAATVPVEHVPPPPPPPASARVQAGLLSFGQSLTRRFGGEHAGESLSGGLPVHAQRPVTAVELITPPPKVKKRTEEDTLSEKILFFSWAVCCCCTITLALHNVILTKSFGWATALTVCWAVHNAVAPVLFFLSIWASTTTMTICCFWLQIVSISASAIAVVSLWFVTPTPFSAVVAGGAPPTPPPPP